jgi:hypothetical protein
MFTSDTARTINLMVETMLRGEKIVGAEKKVLFLTLILEVGKSRSDESVLRRFVNLLYYAPSRYILVGSQGSKWAGVEEHHTWQYRSHHDSCWRHDGTERVLNDNYFDMCKEFAPDTSPFNLWTSADIHNVQFREVKNVDSRRGDGLIHLEF